MRLITVIGLAALGAAALWSGDTCPTCGDAKRVKCYQYEGKGGSQGPCAACLGTGGAPCSLCTGSGWRPCAACGASGSIESWKCRYCEGTGHHRCLVCTQGKAACPVCKGKGEALVACELCAKSGRFPCPECTAISVPCSGCKGAAFEKCEACSGNGEMPTLCATCGGTGKARCTPCDAFGSLPCAQCKGLGANVANRPDGMRVLQGNACRACQRAGKVRCAACKGKGTAVCGDCTGKGTTAASCWLCEGLKTMPCRLCGTVRAWSGESPLETIRCVVFDCAVLQPRLAVGLKNVLRLGDFAVWRVVIDARAMRQRFALGGPDGWELVLVNSAGAETPMKEAYEGLSPDQVRALDRWTQAQGDVTEALKRPFGVAGGDVRTCLALTPASARKDVTLFRMRRPSDAAEQPFDLIAREVLWQTWLQERLLAAPD